ncbi:dolichyl-phosphate beta-glucosyltransferase-like [Ruditapes philippinarum]|uniref:dolichyl-phosphate beta-glucosyltransferase-like n=1 Tax=Ruditapes philippinarum TaxID=129788 RepID=UPI00295B7C6C|nr:dolichyl-phosphate beta-glucosyltransferase-like [Ruditapes philippinarum]
MEITLASIFWALAVLALVFLVVLVIGIYITSKPYPNLGRYESEKFYEDPSKNEKLRFPSIHDPPSMDLSVIVPAYFEEERLPTMMDEALDFLEARQKKNRSFSYEIVVVNDGSTDKTTETALKYSKTYGTEKVRVLTLEKNRGKGGAIRLGMFVARGKQLLFADADGASKFSDLSKLEAELSKQKNSDNMAVVCGSRAHLEKDSIAQRSFFRTVLMYGFHFLVYFLCVKGVKDTQCGFKLLTREAAILLFSNLHVERWAFDVDLLYLAQTFNIPIGEVAISWQEIEGSKMIPVWSWLQMGRDLLLIRLRYILGAWRINKSPKAQ